jgi:DNA-binding LytR/AlgR family response regulator
MQSKTLKLFNMQVATKPTNMTFNYLGKKNTDDKENFENNSNKIRFFKTGKAIHKVDLASVDYVLAYGNYSKLYMANKQLVVGIPLKDIEDRLEKNDFIRIHRSCIVSIRKIEKVMDNTVFISNINLAVGKQYRDLFYEKIFNFS